MDCELLAPAGDFETALAAFAAGADAVYCGLADFSARAFAKNFTEEELASLLRYARAKGKRVFVTFNTLIDESSLEDAIEALSRIEALGVDAIIVQDLGIAKIAREHFPDLELHASTQLVAHNLEGVLALGDLGFRRVVLARELSLEEVESIAKRCGDIELEVFVHGALCYSVSGLCLYGAVEKGRSGNRGQCPYCCRQEFDGAHPFSMKDLRLGEDVRKAVRAGVWSLKIEGRMKSSLYVASVTKYYRDILDGRKATVSVSDLETVFSRRTTELYFNGVPQESPIDAESLGHRGTPIGSVKRITKDREGRSWLRFHTLRALEKHDGLQFDALNGEGRHMGFGITELRSAISRASVFEVEAGADIEVLLPGSDEERWSRIQPGDVVYCSMSNAVKRMFPKPSFRSSDYPGVVPLDLSVELVPDALIANGVRVPARLESAKDPVKTLSAVKKAFSKLGETDYFLRKLFVSNPDGLFAPASLLNDLRRDLVEVLDDQRARRREEKVDKALAALANVEVPFPTADCLKTVRLRAGQPIPAGDWDEVIRVMDDSGDRIALPIYTKEPDFNKLRIAVKRWLRAGHTRFEVADLATLRMLRELGVEDITADWSLYAFNCAALLQLSKLGVRRFVVSPENDRENMAYLAESGFPVEFLAQQSTPLFISLTQPELTKVPDSLAVFRCGELWIVTRSVPRTFEVSKGVSTRVDLSWDPE